jgi:hypothetical protein
LSDGNIALRERFNLVRNIGIDPAAAIQRWLPHINVDLGVAHFDALLAERDSHFAEWVDVDQNVA